MSKRREGQPFYFWVYGEEYSYTADEIQLAAIDIYHSKDSPEYEAVYNVYPMGEKSPRWFTFEFPIVWFYALQDGLLKLNDQQQINPEDVSPPKRNRY